MEQYFGLVPKLRWQDVLDILIVAYVIYRIALLIRGTRTMQMVVGLLVVAGAFVGSQTARPVYAQLAAQQFPRLAVFDPGGDFPV